jgi:hypothetical protein
MNVSFAPAHKVALNMPIKDLNHDIVVRALVKAGWQIIDEHHYLLVGTSETDKRRLYIDIKAQHSSRQIAVLIEVKSLDRSPVHELMEMIGQYLVYRAALDLVNDTTPLYVAIPEKSYNEIVLHSIGQKSMEQVHIPLMIYATEKEEIIRWIPPV